MYRKEYAEFRAALWREGEFAEMWAELDGALGRVGDDPAAAAVERTTPPCSSNYGEAKRKNPPLQRKAR